MFKKYGKGIVSLCLALSLAACGGKEQYTVEEYDVGSGVESGKMSDVTSDDVISFEDGTASDAASGTSLQSDGTLSQKLGETTHVWETAFSASGIDVKVEATSEVADTDELPVYKEEDMKESDLDEEKIVNNLFGGSGKKIERDLDVSDGDSLELIRAVNQLYYAYYLDEIKDLSYEAQMDIKTAKGWHEEDDFYIHTYEGTYNNKDYELFIGFDRQYSDAYIALFPKSIGDYFGNPEVDTILDYWIGSDLVNLEEVKTFLGQDKLQDADVEDRIYEAEEILRKDFNLQIPDDFLDSNRGDSGYDRQYTFYLSGKAINDAGYKNVMEIGNIYDLMDVYEKVGPENFIMDGFKTIPSYKIGNQDIFIQPGPSAARGRFNNGEVYLTEEGVMGFWLVLDSRFEDKMSDNVPILDYDSVLKAFEKNMKENIDPAKIKNSLITFTEVRLVYYPVNSPDVPGEITLVPAWEFGEMNYDLFVLINAMDGSLLDIVSSDN